MADFTEHVNQSNHNLLFLEKINGFDNCYDWQVTTAFYIAVHFVNAHIASQINHHYRSHVDVDNCLNPFNGNSKCKLSEEVYLSYKKLLMLSKRSRYLCNDKIKTTETRAFFTYDKHLLKAIKNLDNLIHFLNQKYPGKLIKSRIKMRCPGLVQKEIKYIDVLK
ncbi:MAG: hypothetical protein HOP31_08760 [Ignavibacteria bacterium]|nr:hypothetical protein [Ignavibacteria bacterium]